MHAEQIYQRNRSFQENFSQLPPFFDTECFNEAYGKWKKNTWYLLAPKT